jgi:hypothetical protein
MGRFYLRFFQHSTEVDWSDFDDETLGFLLEGVFDMCGPTYHTRSYFDTFEDGSDLCLGYYLDNERLPLPKDLLDRTVEFGWGRSRKELRLIGDRLPIDKDIRFQITYS